MSLKRILVLGDAGVGKTQFIRKIIGKTFERRYIPTLSGITKYEHKGFTYYDYPGQEVNTKFINIKEPIDQVYYIYDMTRKMSYENLIYWKGIVHNTYGNIQSQTIGNKLDICGDIFFQDGQYFSSK